MKLKKILPQRELYAAVTSMPDIHVKKNYKTYCTLGDAYLRSGIISTLINLSCNWKKEDISGIVSNQHLATVFDFLDITINSRDKRNVSNIGQHAKGDILEAMMVYYYHYDMIGFRSIMRTIVSMYYEQ